MLHYWREILLGLITLGSLAAIFSMKPKPQDLEYHHFTDTREIWGIPNFFDVVTNLPFLLIGLFGMTYCLTHRHAVGSFWSWLVFFGAMILLCFGSGYYHWRPNNKSLSVDRLAMAIGFMGLFAAVLNDYVNPNLERLLLLPLILLGVTSVIYWRLTDDLRFYGWVQFFPFLCILIILFLFQGQFARKVYLFLAIGAYALAKVAEMRDEEVFSITTEHLSGHSLKHLLASLGVFFVCLMLRF
jgi:hypothetical protein